jgi:hypothetical protein
MAEDGGDRSSDDRLDSSGGVSFAGIAEDYQRYRLPYPEEIFDWTCCAWPHARHAGSA